MVPLANSARRDADAAQTADAIVATWQRIDAALAPVIGSKGVAALYERSRHLAGRIHPWLADAAIDLAALDSVVARQRDTDAVLGCSVLVQTFERLLGDLIGPSLAERRYSERLARAGRQDMTSGMNIDQPAHGGNGNGSAIAVNAAVDPNAHTAALALRELSELRRQIEQARAELAQVRAAAAEATSLAAQLVEANGQLVLAALRAQADADAAAEAAAQARREASRPTELDALTQLPNRVLLRDRLTRAVCSARRRDVRSALLFVDLNNFKQINDTLGHGVGDQVLKLAARRLASSVRAADTVSRHGGDEFVILLAEVGQANDAVVIAEKLGVALAAPSQVGDRVVRLSASIGISLYPDDGEDTDTLIERADAAMYHAKRHGLRSFVFQHGGPFRAPGGSIAGEPPLRLPPFDQAGAGPGRHDAMHEANEDQALAALGAQQQLADAQQAQVRQTEALAMVEHELRSPPIRNAAAVLGRGPAVAQP